MSNFSKDVHKTQALSLILTWEPLVPQMHDGMSEKGKDGGFFLFHFSLYFGSSLLFLIFGLGSWTFYSPQLWGVFGVNGAILECLMRNNALYLVI